MKSAANVVGTTGHAMDVLVEEVHIDWDEAVVLCVKG